MGEDTISALCFGRLAFLLSVQIRNNVFISVWIVTFFKTMKIP